MPRYILDTFVKTRQVVAKHSRRTQKHRPSPAFSSRHRVRQHIDQPLRSVAASWSGQMGVLIVAKFFKGQRAV